MPFYDRLKEVLSTDFEDLYYPEDAVYMERNSRDFRGRIKQVNDNAYDITEYLYSRSIEDTSLPVSDPSASTRVIKKVYYPRWCTPEIYNQAKRTPTLGQGGFGGLFSITFTSLAASQAFFDTIACAKGPSLGTSFTLASPYTLLAHYGELDWAAQYGVDSGLVRISVGQENSVSLRQWFEEAVAAAEKAGAAAQ
jgi:cystathionine gamma-synthase